MQEQLTYTAETPRLLRSYDWVIRRVRKPLAAKYGAQWIDRVFADARMEFEQNIPHIPYIGRRNLFKMNIMASGMYLALYRVLQRQGWDALKAGRFLHEVHEVFGSSFPAWLRRLLGRAQSSPFYIRALKRGAALSQQRRYPADWVFAWVPEAKPFDYGFDIVECAILKFYRAQGADELMPYLCALDHYMAFAMGYGFRREGVLAGGAPCCDCRYLRAAGGNDWPQQYPLPRVH